MIVGIVRQWVLGLTYSTCDTSTTEDIVIRNVWRSMLRTSWAVVIVVKDVWNFKDIRITLAIRRDWIKLAKDLGDIWTGVWKQGFLRVVVLGIVVFLDCKLLHLILDFLQDWSRSGRHTVKVFHIKLGELITQIFLNSLDKVVQVSHVVECLVSISV